VPVDSKIKKVPSQAPVNVTIHILYLVVDVCLYNMYLIWWQEKNKRKLEACSGRSNHYTFL